MNGAGNDFILINNMEEKLPSDLFPHLARTLCTRRLSIGADGFMVVEAPEQGGDLKMLFFNSDGSVGEMCGNGARCICCYACEAGLSGATPVIETTAGIVKGERLSAREYRIRLNDPSVIETEHPLPEDGNIYPASYVVLGDPGIPHACVPWTDLRDADEDSLRKLGRALRFHPSFPKGANVNFYEVLENGEIYERTYERGVEDFTYACGTGTGSVACALAVKEHGYADGTYSYTLHMKGGTLTVDVVIKENQVRDLYLTGPVNIVAKGIVTDDSLS